MVIHFRKFPLNIIHETFHPCFSIRITLSHINKKFDYIRIITWIHLLPPLKERIMLYVYHYALRNFFFIFFVFLIFDNSHQSFWILLKKT